MQCPKCQFENREEVKFCEECGAKIEIVCPACKSNIPPGRKFCGECGYDLSKSTKDAVPQENKQDTQISESPPEVTISTHIPVDGERKHVTVLFSDLTGYTVMSEKLDPEEVKDITSRIFSEISKVVVKYDGFIEKYAGDAVMAIFGVPKAHEDDPVRALKAAREIHQLVEAISPEVENKIGQSISMHTGINTGLVVTGEVNMERGTHGIAGDTINLASRLSNLANPGEIMVDVDTCRHVEGHFACEYVETTAVKGKAEPVQVHKILSQRDRPITIRRLSGMRSDLVGRNVEMAELSEAVDNLRQGTGRVFSICGAAGTGKSRLVEEFKAGLDLEQIQWIEGHAYAYSQDIPYFPLVDLFNRLLQIEENDPPEKVREKVESGIESLVAKQEDVIPYVGGLYSLNYPETKDVSPEFWKSRLQTAILAVLSALADRAPTVFFLEDLHWADPSFVELLRRACLEIRQPAIVLCAYRPTFSLFTGHQVSSIGKLYLEIKLKDLSHSEAQEMVKSLLLTDKVPSDLQRFIQDKMEGNPFYLEEAINTLVESNTLVRDNGYWRVTKPISDANILSTIQGVITARVDRLQQESKRILQEASVIGRSFYYEILKRITELKVNLDKNLGGLERLDLIRTRTLQPDLEYIFKHALTQEVVYSGILKKERRKIHERIGTVTEQLFKYRLPEFFETLAYHFSRGESLLKAVDYLIKSGEKSLKRYAVEESHQYYQQAYDIIRSIPNKTNVEKKILIDLLNKWTLVYYYRGDFKDLVALYKAHEEMAISLNDNSILGMFYVWFGFSLLFRQDIKSSFNCFQKALKLGEESQDIDVIGHSCTWLTFNCADLGLLEDAISFGNKAHETSKIITSDQFLYYKPLSALAQTYWYIGDSKKNFELGEKLLSYGNKNSNIRSIVVGHISNGQGYLTVGDFSSAIKSFKQAISVSKDPFYSQWPKLFLGATMVQCGQFLEAEKVLHEVLSYSNDFGCEYIGTFAAVFMGIILITKGQMSRGLNMIVRSEKIYDQIGWKTALVLTESVLGKVYLQLVEKAEPISPLVMFKNIGFLIKNVPFAANKAEAYLSKSIELAKELGTIGVLGQATFDMGLLHKAKKRMAQAKECISISIKYFEECEADVFRKQANEALESLQ